MKNHKRLLVSQCKYTKTPMSKFECFGHAVKGQCYTLIRGNCFCRYENMGNKLYQGIIHCTLSQNVSINPIYVYKNFIF